MMAGAAGKRRQVNPLLAIGGLVLVIYLTFIGLPIVSLVIEAVSEENFLESFTSAIAYQSLRLSLVIFFGGWAAQNSVEGRQDQVNSPVTTETGGIAVNSVEADKTWWEEAALFVCPAH